MKFDLKEWQAHFEKYEGRVNHFYLDGEDNVTIGVGHLVRDPTGLRMARKTTNLAASVADLFSDFNAVKAMPAGKTADYYGRVCLLYLPEGEIDAMFAADIARFAREVESAIIVPPAIPALVVVDMAYTLGTDGLKRKFPNFVNAVEAGDLHRAALECRREGVQPERNEWARSTLEVTL